MSHPLFETPSFGQNFMKEGISFMLLDVLFVPNLSRSVLSVSAMMNSLLLSTQRVRDACVVELLWKCCRRESCARFGCSSEVEKCFAHPLTHNIMLLPSYLHRSFLVLRSRILLPYEAHALSHFYAKTSKSAILSA